MYWPAAVADLAELRARWASVVGSPADAVGLGEELLSRWSEPHRRYHNLDHLLTVLRDLDRLAPDSKPSFLAAWYHDAVYAPDAADNESRSADLAAATLPHAGVGQPVVAEVCRLVQLTRTHAPHPEDPAGQALCDADLAVLGSPPTVYARYRRAVRAEYGHLDAPTWRAGRAMVLASMLERPYIYSTIQGRARWEAPARRNLIEELGELRP